MAKEGEKHGVAAVPEGGGGETSLGTTGMFVFVVIFISVVSAVVVGSVVVVGGVAPDITPPVISLLIQFGRIGINDDLVLHSGRRWRVRPPPPPTLPPPPFPSL